MKIIRIDDLTAVTTPIFAGSAEGLELFKVCPHTDWVTQQHTVMPGAHGEVLVMQKCSQCGAHRSQLTAVTKQIMDKFLNQATQEESHGETQSQAD